MEIIDTKFIKKIATFFETSGCAQLSDAYNSVDEKLGCFQIKGIAPIDNTKKICGPLFPVNTDNDMLPCLQALDKIPEGYIMFLNNINANSEALAGDIFVTDLINAKSGGLVVNGAIRDISEIIKMGMPTFTKHVNFLSAKTALSKVEQVPQNIIVDNYLIEPNDWIFGDADGLLIVKNRFLNALMYGLQVVDEKEKALKNELKNGKRLAEVCGLNEFIFGKGKLKFEV